MKRYINSLPIAELHTKSYSFRAPTGSTGTFYVGGYYRAPAADANLSEAGATQAYGSANSSYASHAFIVAGAAGTVAAGAGNKVGLKVTGTSITDKGVRSAADTEVLTLDITTLAANTYLETVKKWIGQITFTIYITGGAPATYSLDFNYGLCKYDDINNTDFIVRGIEIVGRAGANDSGANIGLIHHKTTGWTYDAAAFVPGTGYLTNMNTDHNTEKNLVANEHFAWKRDNLYTRIAGGGVEGFVFKVVTGANNAIETMDLHIIYQSEE